MIAIKFRKTLDDSIACFRVVGPDDEIMLSTFQVKGGGKKSGRRGARAVPPAIFFFFFQCLLGVIEMFRLGFFFLQIYKSPRPSENILFTNW